MWASVSARRQLACVAREGPRVRAGTPLLGLKPGHALDVRAHALHEAAAVGRGRDAGELVDLSAVLLVVVCMAPFACITAGNPRHRLGSVV
jgi:hypothetical protein